MPGASARLEAAFVNGKLYAISGFATDRLGIYDPGTNSWTTGAPLPTQFVEGFAHALANGRIYVIGGNGPDPSGLITTLATTFEYDPATDRWQQDASMPTSRSEVGSATIQDRIYVVGGKDAAGKALATVEIFDPTTHQWMPSQALPSARAGMAVRAINGRLYVIGGNDGQNILTSGLVFDPEAANPQWKPIANMPKNTGSNVLRGAVIHDPALGPRLFIVGCGAHENQVIAYDPSTDTWSTNYPALPKGRNDGGITSEAAQETHIIYYVGGGGDVQPLNELDIFSLAPQADAPVITAPKDLDVLSTNEAFDGSDWTSAPAMPTGRAAFGIAEAAGKIYVGGGQVLRTSGCSPPVGILEAFDPASRKWNSLPPMPTNRLHLSAAAVGDKVYFIGGETMDRPGKCHAVGNVEIFNTNTQVWEQGPPMPTPRYDTGIGVSADGKIYVFGGTSNGISPLSAVEKFDPVASSWTEKKSMPTARFFPDVGVVNNMMYAIGGTVGSDSGTHIPIDVVEAYDPATDSWKTGLQPLPTPRRFGPGIAVLDGIIYVFGGGNEFQEISTNEAYDPGKDEWFIAPAMPTARYALGGAVVNGQIFAIGGILQSIAKVDEPFIYQITATNSPNKYHALGLPAGLHIDNRPDLMGRGLIYGVPSEISRNTMVTLKARNGSGSGSALLFLSVGATTTPLISPLRIVTNPSATARINEPFEYQIVATTEQSIVPSGATYNAGGLPPGLTIDSSTGLISGTPSAAGTFAISLSVTASTTANNGAQLTTTANDVLQLCIVADTGVPIVTSPGTVYLIPHQFFSYKITAQAQAAITGGFSYIGSDGRQQTSASTQGLPPGLSFDGVDTISGVYNPDLGSGPSIVSAADATSLDEVTPEPITIRPHKPPGGNIQCVAPTSATQAAVATIPDVLINNITAGSGTHPLVFLQPMALSRKSQGSAGQFDVNLFGRLNVECRSGGPTNEYQMLVGLAHPVSGVGSAEVISGVGQVTSTTFTGRKIFVNLRGVTDKQTITIKVTDIKAGEFTGSLKIPMTVWLGDVTGDRAVTEADIAEVRARIGEQVTQRNARYDVNGDGVINNLDIEFIKAHM